MSEFRAIAESDDVALLGNLIGGSVFVALLNYAHIRKTQEMTKQGNKDDLAR